jgi:anthraniloyl-CoA monooxygenase
MRINIIGGGPSALYFAILMKRQDPSHDITIYERDGPNDTFGWGIVFSGKTLAELQRHDQESYAAILAVCQTWDNVDVVHRGQTITIRGNRFTGTSRLAFLNVLQHRAQSVAVDVQFRRNVTENEIETLAVGSDLLIGADGANSLVRRYFESFFEPTVDLRRNRYIWLGTNRLFDGLTFLFRPTPDGVFVAHCYKFSPAQSTFVVECTEPTWQRAGFENLSELQSCAYLERVFAEDLQGHALLTNNFVRWLNFPLIRNRYWSRGNVVLLGDALHTAHFSIGSGTKLALEDSIALTKCFADGGAVSDALARFEQVRRPPVEEYQNAAHASLLWFENIEEKVKLDPIPLAYEIMTRSGRIDLAEVRKRDPQFAALYDDWRTRQQSIRTPSARRG